MPELEFRQSYQYESNDRNGIVIPVTLRLGDAQVNLDAKLDTGAEHCLFQRDYGEILGLTVEEGRRMVFRTVNSEVVAFGHELSMEVLDIDFDLLVYIYESRDMNRSLLGRTGWLSKVRLGLVDYDSRLLLSHYDD